MSVYHAHSKRQRGMTTTRRRILYLAASLLFGVAAPGLIMYAQGYRLQVSPFRISRTLSLAIESTPRDARVILNGVDKGATPAIFSGLAPGTYTVQIQHPRYQAWSTQVTLASASLTLTPHLISARADVTTLEFSELQQTVISSRDVIALTRRTSENETLVAAFDTKSGFYSEVARLSRFESEKIDVVWSNDGLYLLVGTPNESLIFENTEQRFLLSRQISHQGAERHKLIGQTNPHLVFLSEGTAWSVSLLSGESFVLGSPNIIDLQEVDGQVALLRGTGNSFLRVAAVDGQVFENQEIPLPPDGGEVHLLKSVANHVLVQSQRRLIAVNVRERSLAPVEPTDIAQVEIIDGTNEALLRSPNEVWLLKFSPVEARLLQRLSQVPGTAQLPRFGLIALLEKEGLRFLDPTRPEASVGSFPSTDVFTGLWSINEKTILATSQNHLFIYNFES